MDDGFLRFVQGFSPGEPQPLNIETKLMQERRKDVSTDHFCLYEQLSTAYYLYEQYTELYHLL